MCIYYRTPYCCKELGYKMAAPSDSFIKFSLLSSLVAGIVTFFYIKLTGKDDKDLHKQVFRICVLLLISNSLVYYMTYNGKDTILTEPFFS